MAHNGKILQTNCWALNYGGTLPFANCYKDGGVGGYGDDHTSIPVSALTSYGFLKQATGARGVQNVFWCPKSSERPGNWIAKWKGTCKPGLDTATVVSGTYLTATSNGRVVHKLDNHSDDETGYRYVGGYSNTLDSDPLTSYAIIHEDDEAAYDLWLADHRTGSPFNPDLITRLSKFGYIRTSLDWCDTNFGIYNKWAHNKPIDYICWSGNEVKASLDAGVTSGSFPTFTVSTTHGSSPQHLDTHMIEWGSDVSGAGDGSPIDFTINTKKVFNFYGRDFWYGAWIPKTGGRSMIVYSAIHNGWFLKGGAPGGSGGSQVYLDTFLPWELQFKLCAEAGAHPHFTLPYLCQLDTTMDFFTGLVTAFKAFKDDPVNNASWMIPTFEGVNENWPIGDNGFPGNGVAKAASIAKWGSEDIDSYYGYVMVLMGRICESILGHGNYEMFCGVWALQSTASASLRMTNGKYVTVDGMEPLSTYCKNIGCASYYGYGATAQSRLDAAYAMDAAVGSTAKQAIADAWVRATPYFGQGGTFAASDPSATAQKWGPYCKANGFTFRTYEGGNADLPSGQPVQSDAISGASKAASCVLIITGLKPSIGASLTPSGVVGMTQLNGNTYTVTGVSGNNVTINVNSTGFTTYVSGGTATYTGSGVIMENFTKAIRSSTATGEMAQKHYSNFAMNGGKACANYTLAGNAEWGMMHWPNLYGVTGQGAAAEVFSAAAKPITFRVTTS